MLAALAFAGLAGCAMLGDLPEAVSGPATGSAVQQAQEAMCRGPQQGEVQRMKELADEEAEGRAGKSWSGQQLAAGVPPEAVELLTDALAVVDRGGDPDKAEALILEAMRLEEAALAPLAPARLTSAGMLANLYARSDRFAEAIPLERYVVALDAQAYGPFYDGTVDHMMRLAILEAQVGAVEASKARYACARNAASALWGPDAPMLVRLDQAFRNLSRGG